MLNSLTTTDFIDPVHPGEVLRLEFLDGFELSGQALAEAIHVPAEVVDDLVNERRGLDADLAIRLARFFSTTEAFWMKLQSNYDLRVGRKALGDSINDIAPLESA